MQRAKAIICEKLNKELGSDTWSYCQPQFKSIGFSTFGFFEGPSKDELAPYYRASMDQRYARVLSDRLTEAGIEHNSYIDNYLMEVRIPESEIEKLFTFIDSQGHGDRSIRTQIQSSLYPQQSADNPGNQR